MISLSALLPGTDLSPGLVGLARTYEPRTESRIHAAGLVIAALLYVFFGVVGGAGPRTSLGT